MTDEQRAQIIEYARLLSTALPAAPAEGADEDALLVFVVDDIAERVLLYLNATELPSTILRVLARIVVAGYQQANAGLSATAPEQEITSLSDNGQTVSYSDRVKQYFATADDSAIFGSFTKLLEPYRSVKVVRPA